MQRSITKKKLIKLDSYSCAALVAFLGVKDVARGHLIKHIDEGSNVINVCYKSKKKEGIMGFLTDITDNLFTH